MQYIQYYYLFIFKKKLKNFENKAEKFLYIKQKRAHINLSITNKFYQFKGKLKLIYAESKTFDLKNNQHYQLKGKKLNRFKL